MERIIRVECWADYYFFGKLLQNGNLIRKEQNKFEVLNSTILKHDNLLSIGIIDHDGEDVELLLKKSLKFNNYVIEQKIELNSWCTVIKITSLPIFIFELRPKEFEGFIIKYLEFEGKTLADFDYQYYNLFATECKKRLEHLIKNQKLLEVFKYVLANFEHSNNHIKKIKLALQYLIKNNYNADINKLKHV